MRRAWARIWAANDYNCLRRARYAEWERGTGDPVDRAIGLLADTVHPDHAGERSPSTFSTVNNPTTFQSAVIDAANHALYVAVHPHYAAWSRWIRFDYRTLSVSVHRSADPRLRDETFLAYAGLIHRAMETAWNDREGQKKLEKALLESETQNLFTCQYLFRSRIARGDWERADAAAERTAALYPRDDYAHFYLGNRAREAGRLTEAVEHYRRAEAGRVSCDMDRFLILLRSAFCLDDLGRKEEARDAASRALAVARCYASGGGEEYEKAVARLERLAGEKR